MSFEQEKESEMVISSQGSCFCNAIKIAFAGEPLFNVSIVSLSLPAPSVPLNTLVSLLTLVKYSQYATASTAGR